MNIMIDDTAKHSRTGGCLAKNLKTTHHSRQVYKSDDNLFKCTFMKGSCNIATYPSIVLSIPNIVCCRPLLTCLGGNRNGNNCKLGSSGLGGNYLDHINISSAG